MKRIKTFTLAATILTLTLGAFSRHASAAANAYLNLDGIKGEIVTSSPVSTTYVISILWSVLLP